MNLQLAQKTAVQAARAAGRLMRLNWYRPKRVKLTEAHDIKLELDVRCQKLIGRILHATFPQIPLLGEEGNSGNVNAAYRWVVDPIDGTVNYFFGMPHAAVSIALQARSDKWHVSGDKKGVLARNTNLVTRHMPAGPKLLSEGRSHVTLLGVIYDPFADELWTALRGGPARLNGKIIRVSRRSRLEDAVIAMGFSKSQENLEKSLPHVNRLARRVKKIRILGSAALELAYVASGRLDAYIERTINLWDVAAGALLIECAGGEFHALPAPGGKLRMCADNGRLRRKLKVESLLK